MLRYLLLSLLLMPWFAAPALPGAWPRAKGTAFVATSAQIEGPDEHGVYRQNVTLFAEYGLTERLTLGVDVGGDAVRTSKTVAFLRWPVGPAERPLKLAVELGGGQVQGETALRPGLNIGRGIKLWERYGWLAVDSRAVLVEGGGTSLEGEATFGLSVTARSRVILQLQVGAPDEGRDYTRFAPSFVYQIRPGAHIEAGLIEPLTGAGHRGFKLGLWRSF
ncbi:hypothetical protein RA2_00020 [Roseovarius sp. A-2]|uniref:hypothetical protein n=1 Tax=Roseovarius sp. A-2 TaxID=1570360 RepID=UPI0009B5595F|nr:hypothetical protein [Roseovarius sp. A-2]GAW32985.1 hypothetical protein RA2_00020 [Roseovarius sp. A-2]